jgi:protein TonB
VQRQVESGDGLTAAEALALQAALAGLGALKPARRSADAAAAARALPYGLGGLAPGAQPPREAAQPAALPQIGALALPPLTPAQRRRRVAFKVAAIVSVLLHAGSLCAFLAWHGADVGAVEQPSEAISVEIVASHTLEAAQPKQIPEPAPAPEATAPVEGVQEPSKTARPEPAPQPEPEPEVAVPQPPLIIPEAAEEVKRAAKVEVPGKVEAPPVPVQGPTEVVPEPPKAQAADEDVEARRKQRETEHKKKAPRRAPKGGVTAKAKAGKGTGGERASARRGSLLNYAAHVRARVARNKPPGGGLRGTAVVAFGVTTSGRLAFARVSRSSGSAALDRLAVAAVRGAAPFPTPPAGATAAQLQFSIPFYFE